MPGTSSPVRLSKAAKEFNVAVGTLVEFLTSKGVAVENNPNTKIDNESYELLIGEFQGSKQIKEKSKLVGMSGTKRETITLERERPAETPRADEDAGEEVLIKNVQGTDEDIIKPTVAKKVGVSVVGKIDLEKTKKPAPAKAEPPKKEEKKEPIVESKTEEPKQKAETANAVEKEKEAPVENTPEQEKPVVQEKPKATEEVERETYKTVYNKLSGLTVVGKIALPEKPQKVAKPVVSTNPDTETQQGKRKRKRIAPKAGAPKPQQQDNRGKDQKGGPKKGQIARGGIVKEVSKEDIDRELKETLAKMSGGNKSKGAKQRRAKRDEHSRDAASRQQEAEAQSRILRLTEFVTVSDLASLMNVQPIDVIKKCMDLGIIASINQRIDAETIAIVAEEFDFEVEFTSAEVQEAIPVLEDREEDLLVRAPIVTVMGHVDHGKTSLLDYVRKENVIAGEAGGITQHIGAYNVMLNNGRQITFLDTPGHEAFTAMRARGAQVTDLAIIVVAADDEVMPQTREAINHAQAAGIPMVFAINKIDKNGANPEKIKEQLAGMNILVEDWGGKFQSQEISAKQGTNVEELLEKVLLEADILDLKANPNKLAVGTIIESSLDKGRGYVCTMLVEGGTLKVGDVVLAGHYTGKVKAMFNERGQEIKAAGPAQPVSMLGLNGAPNAGDKFNVMEDEREARNLAARREQLQREQGVRTKKHITLDEIGRRIKLGDFKELNIILKGDVDGSVEALTDSLQKLSTEKIQVNVIHKAVGQITESDVLLATASDAIIIGFQVRPSASARRIAEKEQIQIKIYSVIYAAIEDVKDAMEGMLDAKIEEQITGNAEIRETFKITKVGTIAGCFVTDGKLNRNSKVRIIRDGIVVYTGHLGSLKRFKDDVKEVSKGYECGLNIDKFNDVKVGDIVEAFEEVEVKQTL